MCLLTNSKRKASTMTNNLELNHLSIEETLTNKMKRGHLKMSLY